jgi:hypothetical protein
MAGSPDIFVENVAETCHRTLNGNLGNPSKYQKIQRSRPQFIQSPRALQTSLTLD